MKTLLAVMILLFLGAQSAHAAITIRLVSSPGELVGGGITETLTDVVDSVFVYKNFQGGIRIYWYTADNSRWFELDFTSPNGRVEVGEYPDAEKSGFQEPTHPGMIVCSYRLWNCNTVSGSFTVMHIVYNASGLVAELEMSFIQSCNGSPELRGQISYLRPSGSTPARLHTWGAIKSYYR